MQFSENQAVPDSDDSIKIALLRQMMKSERYIALYELMGNISKYSGADPYPPMSDAELLAWNYASFHLDFLSRFGNAVSPLTEINGKLWFAHPVEFENWLALGAPGFFLDDLRAYLDDFPL
ncbi:hypothetical protein ACO0LD_26900 [Undibacterium sp. Ji83W]|uniref:hypothetical protein n=1 Tax=Undibacterium sp. Ji83W TaxID=3413043 RepID=UPI003BF2A421